MPKNSDELIKFAQWLIEGLKLDEPYALIFAAYREGLNDGMNALSPTHGPDNRRFLGDRKINNVAGGRGLVDE